MSSITFIAIPNVAPILVALMLISITVALSSYRKSKQQTPAVSAETDQELASDADTNKDRELGEWNPVKFRYPPIEASTQSLSEIRPIPYRPFRWGAYHVTMGIRNMPWNDWIELDQDHDKYHKIKAHRMKTRLGDGRPVRVLGDEANEGTVHGGGLAAVELVHELAEYLSRRYPREFSVARHAQRVEHAPGAAFADWGWDGLPAVRTITMTSLGASFALPLSVADGDRAPEQAMEVAGLLIQDDLALMIEGIDGRYYFQAGSICLPGFWRIQDKIGMPLEEIHLSGNVPQYKERLQTSLERFFRRLAVDKPVVRNNYFFQVNRPEDAEAAADAEARAERKAADPEELAWAESTLGQEETYGAGGHGWDKSKDGADARVEWVRLRTERQTLRRLGRSGAVVFTIRTYLTPVVALGAEAGVPARLASALRSWPEDVGAYKGKGRGGWFDAVVGYLDGRAGLGV